jgi:hypothetical protein
MLGLRFFWRGRFASRAMALLIVTVVALVARGGAAADGPIDPKTIPPELRPWTEWVLDGVSRCPTFFEHADQTRCAWPARLDLSLGDHGGTFVQTWHIDAKTAVALPGSTKHWPADVTIDGKPGIVVTSSGAPFIELGTGEHTVRGRFLWDSLPESLSVPKETGILSLALRGAPVALPNRDAQGMVWFQKAATNEEGESLGVVVHRKVTDDIPLRLTTRIELHVSGKSREELLGKALPEGFVPMSLDSPLPARVEPDGRVRVQVRPGVFALELVARAQGPVAKLTRPAPDGPWKEGDEVWVFEAKNDYRVVSVAGVRSIDPQQTTLPDAWKRLPAYPMPVGATMQFVESRRGDADPPPDQLTLARSLWLDFDGRGFTVQDLLTGSLSRESRLTMAPPTQLGRVAIGGRDQFITSEPAGSDGGRAGATGVEVRQGHLSVTADSRIAGGDVGDIPAVGWAHDFHQVTGTLHLPPGWTLLFATGVDDVPGTWIRHWSLLEIFLGLIIGIVIGRLFGLPWGAAALAMLLLTLPEADAPKWVWIPLLGLEALVRVLPKGRVQRVFDVGRILVFLALGILTIPFIVQQVRQGLHPALLQPGIIVGAGQVAREEQKELEFGARKSESAPAAVPVEAPPASPAPSSAPTAGDTTITTLPSQANSKNGLAGQGQSLRGADFARKKSAYGGEVWQSNSQVYDPGSIVQTGPGLPRWQWTTLDLRWSGPVASTQRLHLHLVSPGVNLFLAILRSALLLLLAYRLLPYRGRILPRFFGPGAAAAGAAMVAFALILLPRVAHAEPDKAMLEDLKARLTRPPGCSPSCASAGRMAVDLRGNMLRLRLDVDAAATTAVALPGTGAQWNPSDVRVDGKPAAALAREGDVLWVAIEQGAHQILLEGPMPDRASVQLSLSMKPHHVEVSAEGWSVAGVHEDGIADDDLQFTRTETPKGGGGAGTSLQPGALPPFVLVTRTLHVGLDWEMETEVARATPLGSAVVLEIPLLAGEKVTTADVRVVAGKVQVFLGPDAREMSWKSVLAQKSPIHLVAPKDVAWSEVWKMDIGSIWHASYSGLPFVHAEPVAGTKIPEWRPWPGEEGVVTLSRPDGVPGQSLTIDQSTVALRPGLRATDVTLSLTIRSSRGGDHTLLLPEGAQLESLSINNASQPIRQEDRKVKVPIVPGAQSLDLVFRVATGLGTLFLSPAIDLGAPSVNATVTLEVPSSRWLLFTKGPRVGPAILFWSLLLVLLVVAFALGQNHWTPLRTWHWALLFIGLSQVDIVAGAIFVGWLLMLGYRANEPKESGLYHQWFNLRQVVIVAWTLLALGILADSLHQGLLGTPEMQVLGNGSSSSTLRWFTDRADNLLPSVGIVSVPLFVYRGAMLAWALWIVLSLLSWLRWGWGAFTHGGGWRRGPPRPPRAPRTGAPWEEATVATAPAAPTQGTVPEKGPDDGEPPPTG